MHLISFTTQRVEMDRKLKYLRLFINRNRHLVRDSSFTRTKLNRVRSEKNHID